MVFGQDHVILNAIGRNHHVRDFPGPLSIKSVLKGTATWETTEGRFEIGPGSCVILNDRQPYSITVESRTPVETLCVFFARGLIEGIHRASTVCDSQLLDRPSEPTPLECLERIRHNDFNLFRLLGNVRSMPDRHTAILALGEALVRTRRDT